MIIGLVKQATYTRLRMRKSANLFFIFKSVITESLKYLKESFIISNYNDSLNSNS